MRDRVLRRGVAVALGALLVTGTARGHVEYVVEGADHVSVGALLRALLADPSNVAVLVGGGLGVALAAVGYLWVRPLRRDVEVFREAVRDYADLVPWLLRLSVGLPLVGAGFSGYFFTPAAPPFIPGLLAPSRLFQIGVGFLILFGLATRAAAVAGLAAYLVGVAFDPKLLLALEYVGGFLAIALLGSGRPSADHVLARVAGAPGTAYGEVDPIHRAAAWLNERLDPYEAYTATILRATLGLSFAFLGVTQKLLSPGKALAVVEKYDLTALVGVAPELWIVGAGLAELALGLALLAGVFTRATAIAALGTFTLTLFGLPDDPVLAHVSLFGMASALLVLGAGPYAVDGRLGRGDRPSSERGVPAD